MYNDTKLCNKCDTVKPLSEFPSYKYRGNLVKLSRCKACAKLYAQKWLDSNKERINEYNRINYKNHLKDYHKEYYIKHREEMLAKAKVYYKDNNITNIKKHYKKSKEGMALYNKQYREKAKVEVLTYYGNGKLACVKCGFNNIKALSIDHINGDGAKHRNIIGKGRRIYIWLKKNNLPIGFQTLCMNCQWVKRSDNQEDKWHHKQILTSITSAMP